MCKILYDQGGTLLFAPLTSVKVASAVDVDVSRAKSNLLMLIVAVTVVFSKKNKR